MHTVVRASMYVHEGRQLLLVPLRMRTKEAARILSDSFLLSVTFPHQNGSTDVYGHRDESHEVEDVSIFRYSSLYADVHVRERRFTTKSTGR